MGEFGHNPATLPSPDNQSLKKALRRTSGVTLISLTCLIHVGSSSQSHFGASFEHLLQTVSKSPNRLHLNPAGILDSQNVRTLPQAATFTIIHTSPPAAAVSGQFQNPTPARRTHNQTHQPALERPLEQMTPQDLVHSWQTRADAIRCTESFHAKAAPLTWEEMRERGERAFGWGNVVAGKGLLPRWSFGMVGLGGAMGGQFGVWKSRGRVGGVHADMGLEWTLACEFKSQL